MILVGWVSTPESSVSLSVPKRSPPPLGMRFGGGGRTVFCCWQKQTNKQTKTSPRTHTHTRTVLLFVFVVRQLPLLIIFITLPFLPEETPFSILHTAKMNPEQVKKQLDNMEAFILKEAREKKQEILDKAEEEFTMEKARLVQAEKQKIKKEYERKEKKLETDKKMYVKQTLTIPNSMNSSWSISFRLLTCCVKQRLLQRVECLPPQGPESQRRYCSSLEGDCPRAPR